MRNCKDRSKATRLPMLFFIVESLLLGVLHIPVSAQDPEITDIMPGTKLATWKLEEPSNYTIENITFQNGEAALSVNSYSWFEGNLTDFQDGSWDPNVSLTPDGNITLLSDNSNLVSNGDFSTDSDWFFSNGTWNYAIAERDSSEENAHLYHYDPAGSSILIDDFESASNITNWTSIGVGASLYFNTSGHASSGSMEIGWKPVLPTDDGGARRSAPTSWDWSSFNTLSLWITTLYTGAVGNLAVRINIIDLAMVSWESPRKNVSKFPGWRMYSFDLSGFSGDLSQIDSVDILFDGINGSGTTEYRVTIDDFQVYEMKRYDEAAYCNQTFLKANRTGSSPGNVMLSFDVLVEDSANLAESYLNLTLSNSTTSYKWERYSLTPPYSAHVVTDVSWLTQEAGSYEISMQLWISVNTRLVTKFSARFDNITLYAPNRRNGTYLSEPHDTFSQSIWRNISWTLGEIDPEISITVFTRSGNSSNTADPSWSKWRLSEPMIMSPPNRYIQYRVDLNTTNASKAPTLVNVRINFEQYSFSGHIETRDFSVANLYMWEEFQTVDFLMPQTSLAYYYSPDMGGSWVPISNGSSLSSVTNKTLRFKAELRTSNTTLTPRLAEMSLSYQYLGPLDHIHMSLAHVNATAGSWIQLSAYGHDSLHRNVSFTQKWETTDPLGSVDVSGNYTPGKVGSWIIYCNNSDDSVSNYTLVDVSAGPLERIEIEPWNPGTLTADDEIQFNATGYDIVGNIVPASPVWTVLGGIGIIDPGPGPTSLFLATKVGTGKVVADDGMGHINQTKLFSVIPGRLASIQVSPSYVDLVPGEPVEFYAQGKDADGNNITLTSTSWETNAGVIVESNATSASFVAQSEELIGGFIRASQGSLFGEAVINIDDMDDPPTIQGTIPDQFASEDYGQWSLNLTQYASDEEDDISKLRWRVTGKNSSLYSIAGENTPGNHILTFSTKKDAFGSDEIELWLIDSKGQSDSQSIWVNITPVNDRPRIFAPDKEFVRFDVPRVVDYSPYIEDVDNSLNDLTLTTSDSAHAHVQGLQVSYEYPESMIGQSIFVILTISDGQDQAQHVVEIVVSGNYPPRVFESLPDVTMNEDKALPDVFNLNDYFEDPDDNKLTFDSLSENVIVDIDSDGMVSLSSKLNWFGDELVIFSAFDSSGAYVQDAIMVSVLPINDPPEIAHLPDLTIHYDVTYNFDVLPYIYDVDNLINDLVVTCSEPNYSVVLGTIVSFNFPIMGERDVTITVSDGIYQDSEIMRITITDNHPPISVGLPDIFFNEDEFLYSAFDLDDYFYDPEGDILAYTFNLPQTFVEVTLGMDNIVSFSSSENWSGQQVVVFRATDEEGAFTEEAIIVTVVPVNDAPVIYPIPKQTGRKDKAWVLNLEPYLLDSDNDTSDLVIDIDFEYATIAGHYLIFNCEESFDSREATLSVTDGLLEDVALIEISVSSYVQPELQLFIWPTALVVVLLSLFGLTYWRASRKFAMEDIFLVKKDGKVMVHKTIRMRPDRDEDMFSSMLTAIHSFAQDTFREEGESLRSFESENKRVVLEAAKTFYVAAIFARKEPKWALKSLKDFVADVETMYGARIESWSGVVDDLGDLPKMVDHFISRRRYSSGDWMASREKSEERDED